jgi:hypothetical protein
MNYPLLGGAPDTLRGNTSGYSIRFGAKATSGSIARE